LVVVWDRIRASRLARILSHTTTKEHI
jgi:hypothetical protein